VSQIVMPICQDHKTESIMRLTCMQVGDKGFFSIALVSPDDRPASTRKVSK